MNEGGTGQTSVRCIAYADDIAIYLANFTDLRGLGPLMRDYNTASGARTNWTKCDGLRLGTLHLHLFPSQMHEGKRKWPTIVRGALKVNGVGVGFEAAARLVGIEEG